MNCKSFKLYSVKLQLVFNFIICLGSTHPLLDYGNRITCYCAYNDLIGGLWCFHQDIVLAHEKNVWKVFFCKGKFIEYDKAGGMKILKLKAWNFSIPPPLQQQFNFLGALPPVGFEVYKFLEAPPPLIFSEPPIRVSKNFRSPPLNIFMPPCYIKWTFPKRNSKYPSSKVLCWEIDLLSGLGLQDAGSSNVTIQKFASSVDWNK